MSPARVRRARANEGGQALAFVAVTLVVLLGMAGLALDSGRAYLQRARLSRTVDGGALAAARALRQGEDVAWSQARAVAAANGFFQGRDGLTYSLAFGTNDLGEQTVLMRASQPLPTTFMRVLGRESVDIGVSAMAAVPPVDLVLVLDQSGSLERMGAWQDLQESAKEFVRQFEDRMDQVGLVSFQARAHHNSSIGAPFRGEITAEIDRMTSAGDTNTGEGLRYALQQMGSPVLRDRSAKVVVFFTDGRPTAFRGMIDGEDRVMAVPIRIQSGQIRGYYDDPDRLPMNRLNSPDGCANAQVCFGWTQHTAREQARSSGLAMAAAIRARGVFVYSIALGDPTATDPLETPDLAYLDRIANVNGISDPDQPQGKSYFAPSAAQLRDVFGLLAQDLLVRLAQ